MEFTYETQGTNTYFVYKLRPEDEIDTISLNMMKNNKINGLAPVVYTQMDEDRYLKFNISSKVALEEFLHGFVTKKNLVDSFAGIVNAAIDMEEYMMDTSSFILDKSDIFIDVSTHEVAIINLPISNIEKDDVDLGLFFKNIIFDTQFDQNENGDYVGKIINYLNTSSVFSPVGFKTLIESLATTGGTPVQRSTPQVHTPPQVATIPPVAAPTPPSFEKAPIQPQAAIPQKPSKSAPQNVPPVQQQAPQSQYGFSVPDEKEGVQNPNYKGKKSSPTAEAAVPVAPTNGEKEISMFNLLMHYSKENKEAYNAQKGKPKASKQGNQKKQKKSKAVPTQPVAFSVPGKETSFSQQVSSPPLPSQQPAPAPQPVQQQPSVQVPQSTPYMSTTAADFGETTLLGGDSEGTTILSIDTPVAAASNIYLVREKTSEKIPIVGELFRMGKEKGYVDYYIGDNATISRSHASIKKIGEEYFIVDTNSTNHTYLDGVMLQSNVEVKLSHGAKIRLANEELVFYTY
jgi:hypothetical protein